MSFAGSAKDYPINGRKWRFLVVGAGRGHTVGEGGGTRSTPTPARPSRGGELVCVWGHCVWV